MKPWRSVRVRLLTGLIIVAVAGLTVGGGTTYLIQRARILSNINSELFARVGAARLVVLGASNSQPADGASRPLKPLPFVTGAAALSAVIGRVLPQSHESSLGILNGRAAYIPGIPTDFSLVGVKGMVAAAVSDARSGRSRIGRIQSVNGPVRYIEVPVRVSGSADRGIFVAAVNENAALADLTDAFTTYWSVALAATIIIGSLGWFVAGRLLLPIHNLQRAASRVTSSRRDERIAVVGNDDLSLLTATVNSMLDRLSQAMTDQRQLLDDVRHELHTPVTIIRGHLEVLDPNNTTEVFETRALAMEELDRVTTLIEDLALLAETQRAEPEAVAVDVAELTQKVFAKASVLPGHEWRLTERARVSVAADAQRITQAWLQLADNAAKYAPPGSPIDIGSSVTDSGVELWVEDCGDGIPEEARGRIFERFGRADAGRGIAGSGLGLSIVQAIVAAHHGQVSLDSTPERTRFTITLPFDGPELRVSGT
jgi:two-component system OmpR family sensor kinase